MDQNTDSSERQSLFEIIDNKEELVALGIKDEDTFRRLYKFELRYIGEFAPHEREEPKTSKKALWN